MSDDFDPIAVLMDVTSRGFLSHIEYDKQNGKAATRRLVEPRCFLEGVNGMLIRCVQYEPKRGVRSFKPVRIVSVTASEEPLRTSNNTFCDAEVVEVRRRNRRNDATQTLAEPWFVEYADVVREAVSDLDIEDWELARALDVRQKHSMSNGQMRAVHAYVFAEFLNAFALDGYFDLNEEEQIEQVAHCLDELGWRPG